MGELRNTTIGIAGLGLMGFPMGRNLQDAGVRLALYNRTAAKARKLARADDVVVATPRELVAEAKIIILMLADTRAVRDVLFGRDGVAKGLGPDLGPDSGKGTLVIDMGTTDVTRTRDFAARLGKLGVAYIDAPVSGGEVGARAGALTIMAGGTKSDLARARPLFDVLGAQVTHVGDVGAGQVAKAANQVIVGLTIGAVAEALALARAAGVDPARVRQALAGGFAASRILDLHGGRMIKGNFKPGGKARTQRKDMVQALALAKECGLDLPATRLNRRLYDELLDAGGGELDHSALFTLYEE